MRKRILSILLVLCLCLGLLPATAWAADEDYSTATETDGSCIVTYTKLTGGTDYLPVGSNVIINLPTEPTADISGKNTLHLSFAQNSLNWDGTQEVNITLVGSPSVKYNIDFVIYHNYNIAQKPKYNITIKNVQTTGNLSLPSYAGDVDVNYEGSVEFSALSIGSQSQQTVTVAPLAGGTADDSFHLTYMSGNNITMNKNTILVFDGGSIIMDNQIGSNEYVGLGSIKIVNEATFTFSNTSGNHYIGAKNITIENSKIYNVSRISSASLSCYVQSDTSITVTGSEIEFSDGGKSYVFLGDSEEITITTSKLTGAVIAQNNCAGIGGAFSSLTIDSSEINMRTDSSAAIGPYDYACYFFSKAPIWTNEGAVATITIKGNSKITAVSERGAAIGLPSLAGNFTDYSVPLTINIEGGEINATSSYGAGIGSGYYNPQNNGNSFDIKTDVKITGGDITAVSRYAAAIGAGSKERNPQPGWAFGVTTSPSNQWGSGEDAPTTGDASMGGGPAGNSLDGTGDSTPSTQSTTLSSSTPTARSTTRSSSVQLAANNGTLILSGGTVKAESGVKAVGLTVNSSTPMMEYTLDDADDVPSVTTPINRAYANTTNSTDDGAGAPSYDLRPEFRSLAFWPVSAGTYTLSYGSGDDPDPLLDVTSEAPTYADTYNVNTSTSALNSFDVIRQQKITGTITLQDGSSVAITGSTTSNTALHLNLTGVTPNITSSGDFTLSYQWYKDGEAVTDATNASYTPTVTGVYYCAVTAGGIYRGTINSKAVTVVTQEETAPDAPTMASNTENSITLTPVDSYEYGLLTNNGIQWQSGDNANEFTNLTRNTSYSFVQRQGKDSAISAAASFTTKPGRPNKSDLTIDYIDETFTLTGGVAAYTDETCGTALTGNRITRYIDDTVYLKYDDVAVTETNRSEVVTAVKINDRPAAPTLTYDMITAEDDRLYFTGTKGVTYAIFSSETKTEADKTITCNENGETITFDGLSPSTNYIIRARTAATATQFHSYQAKVSANTTAELIHIGVTATTSYLYTGSEVEFAFSYSVTKIDKDSFTVTFYPALSANDPYTSIDTPSAIGSYRVNITRNADTEAGYASVDAWFDIEIVKGTQTAPKGTLEAEAVSTDSITLTAITAADGQTVEYGYIMGTGNNATADRVSSWFTTTTFDNLQPGTAYTFFARYKETDTLDASNPISAVIATLPNTPTASEVVSIDYENETLIVKTNYEVNTQQSFNGETISDGDSIKDIIPAAGSDAATVYVRVAASGNIPASKPVEFEIPARPAAPAVPVAQSRTDTSITITPSSGVQYRLGNGDWVTPETSATTHTFTDLNANTEYTITARTPAVASGAEPKFASATVSTNVSTKSSAPDAPTVTADYTVSNTDNTKFVCTVTAVSGVADATYEYRMGEDGVWQNSNVFDNIDPNSTVTFYARIKETNDAVAGTPGNTGEVTFDLLAGTGSVEIGNWTYGETAKDPNPSSATNGTGKVTYEYKTQGADDSTYSSTVPTAAGSYTVRATFAATAVYAEATATVNFTISKATLDESDVKWTYANNDIENGTSKELSGDLTYNGSAYTISASIDGVNQTETLTLIVTGCEDDTGKTITNVGSGSYTLTATLTEEQAKNYQFSSAPTMTVTVKKAAQDAPATGTGYKIDYANEAIEAASGYELSSNESTVADSPLKLTPGSEPYKVYVRKAGNSNHDPSDWAEVTIPARPETPDVTGGVRQISGLDITMEYRLKASEGEEEDWTQIKAENLNNGVLSGLSAGTYEVRVAAVPDGTEGKTPAFASEIVEVTVRNPSAPTYPPTVTDSEGGDTTITPSNPTTGQTVTIKPNPDEGYEVDEVTVTDQNGNPVTVTDNGDGTYSFRQPSGKVTIEVTFREVNGAADCPRDENCILSTYTDVDVDAWYHDGLHYCVERGLMVGTGDNMFSPETPVTRAQVVTVLWRLENEPVVNYAMTFEDVPEGQWYTEAIRWAASIKVVLGHSDTEYGTDDAISRQDMATILYRYASYKGYNVSASDGLDFTDAEDIKDYALTAMQWVCGTGIYEGNGDGTVNPLGDTRRCEYATLMMRFIEDFVAKQTENESKSA